MVEEILHDRRSFAANYLTDLVTGPQQVLNGQWTIQIRFVLHRWRTIPLLKYCHDKVWDIFGHVLSVDAADIELHCRNFIPTVCGHLYSGIWPNGICRKVLQTATNWTYFPTYGCISRSSQLENLQRLAWNMVSAHIAPWTVVGWCSRSISLEWNNEYGESYGQTMTEKCATLWWSCRSGGHFDTHRSGFEAVVMEEKFSSCECRSHQALVGR